MNRDLKAMVLSKIKPTKLQEKKLSSDVSKFIEVLEKASNNLNFKCEFFLGGSYGKGTYLKGKSDIDIFCRFALNYDESKLSEYLEEIIKNSNIDYKKEKGSRDYYSGEYRSFSFELVPVLKINDLSQAKNTTDMSALHVIYLKSIASKNKSILDEIRIAKQFIKSKNLYGAESYINGFSGHVIEILISYYGSFQKFIDNAKDWKEQTVLDISNHYKNNKSVSNNISKDKQSSLILVDPIQKDRNAAKALSKENYSKFIYVINKIENLKESDFTIKKNNLKSLEQEYDLFSKKNGLYYLIYKFDFDIKDQSEDIVGSKLLKISKKIETMFTGNDFRVFESKFHIDMNEQKCLMVYMFENITLSKLKKVQGPKVFLKNAIKQFTKKNRKYEIIGDRIYAYENRNLNSIKQLYNIDKNKLSDLFSRDISFIKKVSRKGNF